MLQAKYFEKEKRYADENVRLVTDFKRLTDRFTSLQMKQGNFERSDAEKAKKVSSVIPSMSACSCYWCCYVQH